MRGSAERGHTLAERRPLLEKPSSVRAGRVPLSPRTPAEPLRPPPHHASVFPTAPLTQTRAQAEKDARRFEPRARHP